MGCWTMGQQWQGHRARRGFDKGTSGGCSIAYTQEINSIESVQKQKQQSYSLARGSLTNLQRKRM